MGGINQPRDAGVALLISIILMREGEGAGERRSERGSEGDGREARELEGEGRIERAKSAVKEHNQGGGGGSYSTRWWCRSDRE